MQIEQTLGTLATPARPAEPHRNTASREGVSAPGASIPHFNGGAKAAASAGSRLNVTGAADRTYLRNAAIALAGLIGSIVLAYAPNAFDRPVTRFVNQWAHRSAALDTAFWSLDACFVFSGFTLMALIWFCWFENPDAESRARLAVGTLIAFPAGCISRLLQHTVPSHPRPFYDTLLNFRAPYLMGDKPLNTWNSFPSDHVTVFAGLVTAICIARPRLSKFVIPYFAIVESARIYMGAHYSSDVLGGAALGVMVVSAAQSPRAVALGRRLLRWETASPGRFYLAAFFLTSAIASLFLEIRTVASYFVHLGRIAHS